MTQREIGHAEYAGVLAIVLSWTVKALRICFNAIFDRAQSLLRFWVKQMTVLVKLIQIAVVQTRMIVHSAGLCSKGWLLAVLGAPHHYHVIVSLIAAMTRSESKPADGHKIETAPVSE